MDFLKTQIDKIQQQLSGLNSSQKMLTATLVAIMGMTLLWWGHYAGQAEMEPVLNQTFSDDEVARITARLASKGIAYKLQGDKVLVPADRKFEVLADLSYSQLMPRDTRTGFDEMIKQFSPWASSSQNEVMLNHARETTLAQVIRNFPQVGSAVVIIDPGKPERRFDGQAQASATVNINLRDGVSGNKQLVAAAADVVSGAHSGLSRGRINVIVNGVSMRVADRDLEGGIGSTEEILGLMSQWERYHSNKVAEQLSFIHGVIVSVNVELTTKSISEQKTTYDPTNSVQKEIRIKNRVEEMNNAAPISAEPGVGANTAVSLTSTGGAGGSTSTITQDDIDFDVKVGSSNTLTKTPAGSATVVSASVRVPQSYFASIWMSRNPSAKDPDDATLQPLIAMELPKIKNDVKKSTGIKLDDDISVETYADAMPLLASIAPAAGATGTATAFVGNYTKQIALGVLALISLFMVLMMARKGSPAAVIAPLAMEEETVQLHAGEAITGEAIEGNGTLDGMELDDDAVKAQQMLDQVSTLVKENPEAAANLVNRWLSKS